MRLYTFELNQQRAIGAEWNGQIIDLAGAYQAASINQRPEPNRLRAIPPDLLTFVRIGPPAMEAANLAFAHAKRRRAVPVGEEIVFPLEAVRLRAPIMRPGKIICATDVATACTIKVASALIGPNESIIKPASVTQLSSAPHLAAVIGRRVKNVAEADVAPAIFGYTMLNSLSARDDRFADNPTVAQNFDTFCPVGPCVVTTDEFQTTAEARFHVHLNGALITSPAKAENLASLYQVVRSVSQFMTLEPGDIIGARCIPNGSDLSLKVGDMVAIEIDGIGRLENPVIAGS
jgi:2-keto-4-pentenoate hydratase/2-oxohepta-3-ene-1,7-dioic acid hydratase in catechol pathway